jgi:hypothetical protein
MQIIGAKFVYKGCKLSDSSYENLREQEWFAALHRKFAEPFH